ncbi:MAG: hypothetical protein ABJG42_24345 [Vibrio splendidus]
MTTVNIDNAELDSDLDALLSDLSLDDTFAEDLDGLADNIQVEEPESDAEIMESKSDIIIDDTGDLEAELAELLGSDSLDEEVAELDAMLKEEVAEQNAALYEDEDFEEELVAAAPATKQEEVEDNKLAASKLKDTETVNEKPKKKAATKSATKSPKKETTPRGPSVSGMSKSEALNVKLGTAGRKFLVLDSDMSDMDSDEQGEAIDAIIAKVDGLPKKVGEKVLNFMQHLNSGVNLSVYSQIAIDVLVEKGTISVPELRAKYEEKYSKGTASAQSSQLIQVIKFLKLGVPQDGNKVAINDDSLLINNFITAA